MIGAFMDYHWRRKLEAIDPLSKFKHLDFDKNLTAQYTCIKNGVTE